MHADALMLKIALIGVLGSTAQWIAWRTGRPAIVFLLAAGLLAGPVFGILDPEADFGNLQQPIIKLAVAVILFEGGLQLSFRDLREAGIPVLRLTFLGIPLGFAFSTLAVRWGTGLSWELSAMLGGILIVTGPTVIGPMLRAINVPRRVGDTLKWEAIINDPIGALIAVAIYAQMTIEAERLHSSNPAVWVLAASLGAALLGVVLGLAITWLFPRGHVAEYLKAPTLLVVVITAFVLADTIQHESGLITVTVMGVVIANRHTFSTVALRRFKEDLSVLLVAGVFIILSATLDWEVLSELRVRFLIYIFLLLFLARPASVLLSLLGSGMPWRERLFIAWIAPRGIVCVAITGLLALRLTEEGVPGAEILVPLAFATAIVTIFAHGFTAHLWARRLGIEAGDGNGLLLVGVNDWSIAAAQAFVKAGVKASIAENSPFAVRQARRNDIDVHRGDMLDENFRHHFNWSDYQHVIACSDSDAYNALVCSEIGPELGYHKVLQVTPDGRSGMTVPRGGTLFRKPLDIYQLQSRIGEGWTFRQTNITDQFTFRHLGEQLGEQGAPLAVVHDDGEYALFSSVMEPNVGPGDTVISFIPPEPEEVRPGKRAVQATANQGLTW